MRYYFTSNEQYGDNKFLALTRSYESYDEMNKDIANKFNSVVVNSDVTFHLGRYATRPSWVERLNGSHIFYDCFDSMFKSGYPEHTISHMTLDGVDLVLSYYPLREWEGKGYGTINVYGYDIEGIVGESLSVSVDRNGMYPLSLGQILSLVKG